MNTVTKVACFIFFSSMNIWSQGVVQVSSVVVEPAKLDCSQGSTARVSAQIAFYGLDSRSKPATVTVGLAIYSATPDGNKVEIIEPRRDIELRESPGLAEFKVACSADTQRGSIRLAATVVAVPAGIKVEPPEGENAVATLAIANEK